MKGFEVLNGCAVLNFLDYEVDGKKVEEFSIKSFNTYAKKLEDGRIGSGKRNTLERYFGEVSADSKTYEMVEYAPEKNILQKYEWDLSSKDKIKVKIYSATKSESPSWEMVKEIGLKKELI